MKTRMQQILDMQESRDEAYKQRDRPVTRHMNAKRDRKSRREKKRREG